MFFFAVHCEFSFACVVVFCVLIETKRNESTANDCSMSAVTCPMPTKPSGPMLPTEAVTERIKASYNMTAITSTNNVFYKNEFSHWTQSVARSVSLSTSDTTNSSRTSSIGSTCNNTINSNTLTNNTFTSVVHHDLFFTQQPSTTKITQSYTKNEPKSHNNLDCDNLTISPEGCTGCHFTQKEFVSDVNERPTYKAYFHGAEITNLMRKSSISKVIISATAPYFNIKEESIISDGYNNVGCFTFDKLLQLCIKNMSQQKYGVNFGCVVKFRLISKEWKLPVTFAPVLIKWTTSKKNSSSSDQLSKSKSTKMSVYQQTNHMIGIKIKPDTITLLNGRSQADVKIGFCFDELLIDGQVVWQYCCIDHLQQKNCYFEACKNSPRKQRQQKKQVKRNHIVSLQTEKINSSYIPVLLLRKDDQFSNTISKIQSRIYFKNLPNCSFDLFATVE